ncbi:hypothetical protein BU16DRAFT_587038 [Lophium mytilinum]|uniref:Uncharacterized protein n=1 Tax=Lophium mytilinum TaxID=390894 RepID=A0A6A6Q951_9PEZI|nr:hypothetical protein BU16DRAFT_587038 [Lophium mytilinum]
MPTSSHPIYGGTGPPTSRHDGVIAIIVFSALTTAVICICFLKCVLIRRKEVAKTKRQAQELYHEFGYERGVRNRPLVEMLSQQMEALEQTEVPPPPQVQVLQQPQEAHLREEIREETPATSSREKVVQATSSQGRDSELPVYEEDMPPVYKT